MMLNEERWRYLKVQGWLVVAGWASAEIIRRSARTPMSKYEKGRFGLLQTFLRRHR